MHVSRSKYMERCWPVKNNPLLRIQTSRIARSLLEKSYSLIRKSLSAIRVGWRILLPTQGQSRCTRTYITIKWDCPCFLNPFRYISFYIQVFCLSMLCPKYGILSNFSLSHNTLSKMSTFIYVYTINLESERKLLWLSILFYQ